MDQNNQLKPEFIQLFNEIDTIHLDLFQSIHCALRSNRQYQTETIKIIDILKEHEFSEVLIREHFPSIYPFYHREMVEKADRYYQNYQTFYPKFLINLITEVKSEDRIFTSLKFQSSVESSDTSVHSGTMIHADMDVERSVFHEQE
ncbi:hypothetical protein GCM10023116_33940 [Kistimonas scapharcae]|uniref:Uncharacterized protein n=2 Tax=Kistimonas scapharcae TaxID=1036133 RepID=A0ABP8V728_9GAMM